MERQERSAAFAAKDSNARRLFDGLLLLVMLLCMSVPAQALAFPDAGNAVPLLYVGLDEDDGFRYEQSGTGIGFSSVFREDTYVTEVIALFEIDDGVYYELWCDGVQIPYTSGNVIADAGDYQLLIAPSRDQRESDFSIFSFRLEEVSLELYAPDVTISYVRSYDMFGFSNRGEPLFMLSVPNGGVSRDTVYFSAVNKDVSIETVYWNAERQGDNEQWEFSEPGNYLLNVKISILYDYWVAFRILPSSDCSVTFLPFPEEMSCKSLSGARLAGNTLYLPEDAAYRFQFTCPVESGAAVTWTEAVTRDTMLPGVCFSERVGAGRVRREMNVTALSPDASMTVYWDDLPYPSFDGSFTEDGRYRVIVSDRAGNTQDIVFALYRLKRLLFIGGGIVAALLAVLFFSKITQYPRDDQ